MALVLRPVHRVDLGEMALERSPRLHQHARQRVDLVGHRAHWSGRQRPRPPRCAHVQLVSASWSRLERIFSFSASASRLAAAIFSWMSCDAMVATERPRGARDEWERCADASAGAQAVRPPLVDDAPSSRRQPTLETSVRDRRACAGCEQKAGSAAARRMSARALRSTGLRGGRREARVAGTGSCAA